MLETLRAQMAEPHACLRLKAVPKSAKTEVVARMADGTWKIRVAAAPEKGRANAEILRFLSEISNIPEKRFDIVSGASDAFKLVKIRP